MSFHTSLSYQAQPEEKDLHYQSVLASIFALIEGEDDWISAMATVVCELHHAFAYYHWTGFYRVTQESLLKIGPYQGSHGCLSIPFSKGVCGAAASRQECQVVADVEAFPGHIACSASTKSEIVVPIVGKDGKTKAVLDVDSDLRAAFDSCDQKNLEALANALSDKYFS